MHFVIQSIVVSGFISAVEDFNKATRNLDAFAKNFVGAFFNNKAIYPDEASGAFDNFPGFGAITSVNNVFSLGHSVAKFSESLSKTSDAVRLLLQQQQTLTRSTKDFALVQLVGKLREIVELVPKGGEIYAQAKGLLDYIEQHAPSNTPILPEQLETGHSRHITK